MVLSELHATPTIGHSEFTKTYDRVKHSFFWDGMKQDIRNFVAECYVCQIIGHTTTAPNSTCYLEGYLYGFYYRLTQIGK